MAEQLSEEDIQKISAKHAELFKQMNANVTAILTNVERQYQTLIEKGEKKREDESKKTGATILKTQLQFMNDVKEGWTNLWSNIGRGPGVGKGGFGEYGVQVGSQIGAGATRMLATSLGSKRGRLWGMLGSAIGGGIVEIAQAMQQIVMLGASRAQVMTGGRTVRSDYMHMGFEYIQQRAQLQLTTAASQEDVDKLADTLSKLGIPFDKAGKEAIQYAFSAEKVFNLEKGSVSTSYEEAIAKYGETIKDVESVYTKLSAEQQYFNAVARETKNPLMASLASVNTLNRMFADLSKHLSSSGVEVKTLADMFVASTSVMASLGLRPGQMSEITKSFMSYMMPKTSSMFDMFQQGYFVTDLLKRSHLGNRALMEAESITQSLGYDPKFVMMGVQMGLSRDTTGAFSNRYFGGILEGIYNKRQSFKGPETGKNTTMQAYLEGGGMQTGPAFVLMQLSKMYGESMRQGATVDSVGTINTELD